MLPGSGLGYSFLISVPWEQLMPHFSLLSLTVFCFTFSTHLDFSFFLSMSPLVPAWVTTTPSTHRSSGTLWPMPTTP